jgi:hypothetical protein
MSGTLFPLLVLLTLLDLGFVQATGVVGDSDLLPLWALAVGAPWLRRLQQSSPYRALWNVGVLTVFALLVHHATTTGLLHMLEDGLVLAVLCQVHLLNNVGTRQRPDLVFFNSFLVAFVTSFFAPDVTWSALFVGHAFVLVPALQVYANCRDGRELPASACRPLLRDSIRNTLWIGAGTTVVFVAWPRDFQREGWLGEALARQQAVAAGIGDRIRIDDERRAHLGDDVALRIRPASGLAADVPSHWRALTFAGFDGASWTPQDASRLGSRFATDPTWQRRDDHLWQRRVDPRATLLHVDQHDLASQRILLPLAAVQVQLTNPAPRQLDPKSFGGFGLLRGDDGGAPPLRFTVHAAPAPDAMTVSSRVRQHFTSLPDRGVPNVVRKLARELREGHAGADAIELATLTSEWLQQHRRYELPGEPGFARHLEDFLLGSGAGHCEYFATALALLLRVQEVPCRLVGGYLAHEWDDTAGVMVVRSKHAHAWVEVLDDAGRWHTVDATPAADVRAASTTTPSWWRDFGDELDRWWAAVTGFDQKARERWFAALVALPGDQPIACALALAALALLVYRRRQPTGVCPSIRDLQRTARRAGLALRLGETPRELLHRARQATLAPEHLARLRQVVHRHEQNRYGAGTAGELR